jgi:16S rRNA (uracil1498-N3)-methyltransferase
MNNPRLYVGSPLATAETVILPSDIAHYVSNVLRLGEGDYVVLFNGEGGEYNATILAASRKQVQVKILDFNAREAESEFAIHLVQGVSKGERMDWVVQKAVELGVARITPVFTEHGVVHLDGERLQKKAEHWRGIARSACEQSRRNRVPQLDEPVPLKVWLSKSAHDSELRLVLDPAAETTLRQLPPTQTGAILLIGPEGGLSHAEVAQAESAGYMAVRVGSRILRTETAAIAVISALQTLYGDMG